MSMAEIDMALSGSTGLPEIPARPGMAQRWVRTRRGSEDDARNLARMTQRMWHPRDPKTVPEHFKWMTILKEGLGSVVCTDDLILMERDERVQRRAEELQRQRVNTATTAVKRNLFADYDANVGNGSGFSAPIDDSRASVERGRPVDIPDD